MILELANEEIFLDHERALAWPDQKILALSDVHLGKAESFQAAGIPLPSGDHLEEFQRLETLIAKHGIQKVFILGDLIHQKTSWSADLLKDLKDFFNRNNMIEWHLLIGNHERGSMEFLKQLPLKLHEEDLEISPFVFTHGHKQHESSLFEIRGHIHPRIQLKQGPLSLNLPCFWLEKNRFTLPSFGQMTGGFKIKAAKKDRVFGVGESSVFEIPV